MCIRDSHNNYQPPSELFFYRPYIGDNQTLMILDVLERLKPKKCFEWGSGWSTVFFPRFIPEAKWISVEHLDVFVTRIRPHLPPNTTIIHKLLSGDYVEEALRWVEGQPFDFIFVDGEKREECLLMASQVLRKGGIVVKHDAGVTDDPILWDGQDIRSKYEEHGVYACLWWGRK